MSTATEDTLRAVQRWLASHDTRWFLFGAHAVAIYGLPRMTYDIDVTIDAGSDELAGLVADTGKFGIEAIPKDPLEFAAKFFVLPVVHVVSGTPVDVVVAGTSDEWDAFERSQIVNYLGVDIPVISVDDLVIFKFSSERERDYEDARSVIARSANHLDLDYVRAGLRRREIISDRSDLVSEFDAAVARYRT